MALFKTAERYATEEKLARIPKLADDPEVKQRENVLAQARSDLREAEELGERVRRESWQSEAEADQAARYLETGKLDASKPAAVTAEQIQARINILRAAVQQAEDALRATKHKATERAIAKAQPDWNQRQRKILQGFFKLQAEAAALFEERRGWLLAGHHKAPHVLTVNVDEVDPVFELVGGDLSQTNSYPARLRREAIKQGYLTGDEG